MVLRPKGGTSFRARFERRATVITERGKNVTLCWKTWLMPVKTSKKKEGRRKRLKHYEKKARPIL